MIYERPMTPARNLVVFAALNGAVAVALGAFAAHGASPQVRALLTTGAHYQLAHALLALVCACVGAGRLWRIAGWLAASGGMVFALSLAFVGLLSLPAMGAVAPVGGLMMIAGWLVLAFAAFSGRPAASSA